MGKLSKDVTNEIKLYQSNDYEIGEETNTYVLMTKSSPQSFGIHVLLFCTTALVGNVIYAIWKITHPKKHKVMK